MCERILTCTFVCANTHARLHVHACIHAHACAGVALLCDGLGANTALQEIELDYKGLTPVGATALAGALKSNRGLRRLVISRNPAMGDAGVRGLCEGLCESSVRDLQMEEVGMGDEGARALGSALARMPARMQEVSLCGNEALTGEGTGSIFDALLAGPGVESLKLDYCTQALSGRACAKLQEVLRAPASSLRILSLHTVAPPGDGREALASAVGASTTLEHGKFTNMEFGDAGIACLADALAANPSSGLRELDLTGNHATGDAAACLLLSENAPLAKCRRLILFDNRVGTGAPLPKLLQEAAAGGREVGGGLEDLDLGGNKLEKPWILELLSALSSCPGAHMRTHIYTLRSLACSLPLSAPPFPAPHLFCLCPNASQFDSFASTCLSSLKRTEPTLSHPTAPYETL